MRVTDIVKTEVREPLDQVSGLRLRAAIRHHVAQGSLQHVIDLRSLRTLDSATLAGLIQALRAVREGGGSIGLLVDQPHILKILSITGLDRIFPRYASEAQAISALEAARQISA